MSERIQGTVKWFNADKGYGFISQANGADVFAHYSEIQDTGYRSLNEGDTVEFEMTQGKKGLQASQIKMLEKAQ
ncbi:MAG: cold-shock protein [Anaerolineales bacterium]